MTRTSAEATRSGSPLEYTRGEFDENVSQYENLSVVTWKDLSRDSRLFPCEESHLSDLARNEPFDNVLLQASETLNLERAFLCRYVAYILEQGVYSTSSSILDQYLVILTAIGRRCEYLSIYRGARTVIFTTESNANRRMAETHRAE